MLVLCVNEGSVDAGNGYVIRNSILQLRDHTGKK